MIIIKTFFKALRGLFITPARAASLATVSAAIIYSGFELNQRSIDTLAPTGPEIRAVTHCAATKPIVGPNGEKITFVVYHGLRSESEQRSMVARGVSWVNRSRHQDGLAIDVMAVVDGKSTWDHWPYYKIAEAFYQCGNELRIPIAWGGEWKVKDMVHFEVKR